MLLHPPTWAGRGIAFELGEDALSLLARPRAQHGRFRRTKPRTDARQGAADGADRDGRPAIALHLQAQQLARPGRPTPAEVLRRALTMSMRGAFRVGCLAIPKPQKSPAYFHPTYVLIDILAR